MPSNIISNGVDTDNLFAPFAVNAMASDTGYRVNGVDIKGRYDILSNPALANAGARIPESGIKISAPGYSSNTDLASVFCGNAAQYALSTPAGGTQTVSSGFSSPRVWTHTLTVTFASAAALTNYFNFGGRIQISPAQSGTVTPSIALGTMFANLGTLIIYDAGHYKTGAGGTLANATTGGANIGTTPVSLLTTTGGLYSDVTYTASIVANAAVGSATVLTITTVLTILGTTTFNGTYSSNVQQRNHPTQAVPTFSSSLVASLPVFAPVANFIGIPINGTVPLNVSFTDISTNTPTAWLWNFGDGTTSTLQNPTKTYSVPGSYTVTLTASNSAGSDAEVKTGFVNAALPVFNFTISSNQTNANLRTLAVNAGWNQSNPVAATIPSGVYVSSNDRTIPAMVINGSFPNGVTLTNNGFIIGMGGAGGSTASGGGPIAPSSGGTALSVSVPVTINNASGTIAGGGGGGGQGGRGYILYSGGGLNYLILAPYGGGGGGRSGLTNSAGGSPFVSTFGPTAFWQESVNYLTGTTAGSGTGGTLSIAGFGGLGSSYTYPNSIYFATGGGGGAGGLWGATGAFGSPATNTVASGVINASSAATPGAAGGAATAGAANITWTSTGTRLGTIG